jgi:hypothetical protein
VAEQKLEIQSITFMQDGIVVQFLDVSSDIRNKGALVLSRQLSISAAHPDYRDDIEGLHHRAVRVLKNALEDFEDTDPVDPAAAPDEEEQELGMGHG